MFDISSCALFSGQKGGSLLDGELIENADGGMTYLVYDIVLLSGVKYLILLSHYWHYSVVNSSLALFWFVFMFSVGALLLPQRIAKMSEAVALTRNPCATFSPLPFDFRRKVHNLV